MKKYNFILLIVVLLLFSCTNINKTETKSATAGYALRVNETNFPHTTFPYNVNSIVDFHILSQIYNGLVKYDAKDLSIIPDVATRWEVTNDGKQYIFHLNKNVFFHKDKCFKNRRKETTRKVKASDFKYSFKLYCFKSKNVNHVFFDIVGAKEYQEEKLSGKKNADISGIKVVDDSTLIINLKNKNPLFIYFLAGIDAVVLPHEAVDAYGENSMVGTGPYFIKKFLPTSKELTLYKNTKYFKKDKKGVQLPYISTIVFSFISSTREELEMFEQGDIDMVLGLTGDFVNSFLNNNIDKFQSNPPIYILKQTNGVDQKNTYNFLRANVHNLFFNRMNYIDLSVVSLKQPTPRDANMK